jgi:hypothetical protein
MEPTTTKSTAPAPTTFFKILPLRPDFSPAEPGRVAVGLATIPLVAADFPGFRTIATKCCCDHHGFISCN